MKGVRQLPWYDAHFLRRFEAAKQYLALLAPDVLDEFVAGFAPLRPPADFAIRKVDALFDTATRAQIVEIARNIPAQQLERHEIIDFGRHVVHDHPTFIALQRAILPRVSELAGRQLEAGYNFLSLYGGAGKCDPHMDEPISMYTLDYCIEQSEGWPIRFSNIVDWPQASEMAQWQPDQVLENPALSFETQILEPGEAILFNGSSQWHYRDSITPGGFCSLLFFHYYPKGCHDLVWPRHWARYFDMPVLAPLCDMFAEADEPAP